ncbi:MAG: SDR family oxidoreductase [Bacteroidia bacterium]|nr:SDR family oxidoreductase [Bacteroidia bacterium]
MNKTILITGHSKGLGRSLTEKLLATNNIRVIGISRTASGIQHPLLKEIFIDLSDKAQTIQLKETLSSFSFDALVLNAGANHIKPPQSYSLEEINKIIQLNFTSNALLIRMCLNTLLKNKGHIIGIGSYSGVEVKKWNNFYGSSKAGLHHLLRNLFEQYRKQELKVSIVIPDIMNTEFYAHQDFEPPTQDEYSLQVNDVAEMISQWIIQPPKYVPFEIVLRPQMFQLKRK